MDTNEAYETEKILNRLSEQQLHTEDVQRLKDIIQPIIDNEKEKEFKKKRDIKTSWKGFNPHREVTRASSVLINASRLYEEVRSEISKYDMETQDILHSLELTDLEDDVHEEQWKEMQKIRIYRRQAKNFVEAVEPIHNFVKENEALVKKLGKLQGEVMKVKQSIDERQYYPRVKTSLKEAFDKADHIYDRMERLSMIN